MKVNAKDTKSTSVPHRVSASRSQKKGTGQQRERVLIEFPARLLQQTDDAARSLNRNRSEVIRSAVEDFLNGIEAKKLEERLAAAYAANSKMNRDLCEEFEAIDREGL